MPISCQPIRHSKSEEGFVLLAVLFLVFLVLIALAVAAPQVARSIQRDKELELVHRGEQYKRAIKLYYKKFGAYPTSVDQLLNTNNIRFLRKRYTDPITGKDDWRLIYFGQAKVPPMGLFGQPLIGLGGVPGAVSPLAPSAAAGVQPQGTSTGSSFGSVTVDTPDSSNPSGNDNTFGQGSAPNPSMSITGGVAQSNGSTSFGSTSGATGTSGSNSAFGSNSNTGSNTGAFGAALGGGPIVGVGIPIEKASLIEYKKQKKYNQWEFVYNPIEDQFEAGGGLATTGGGLTGTGIQNGNGTGTGIGAGTGTGIGAGSSFGNTGIGSSSGTGNSGTSGPTSQNPQQQ